jgi:hypothetical protein
VRECYIRSGIPAEKVVVIPNGVDLELYRPDGPRLPLRTRKRYKFLFLGGTIGRKGIDALLESYMSAFTAEDDVCLVIKSSGADSVYRHSALDEQIRQLAQQPGAPEIELISENLSDAEVAALYRACDALVHPYRGEGFGMPIAEAMASGLPVIVTGYGACLDFCDESTAYLIPAQVVAIGEGGGLPPSSIGYWWAEPDRAALVNLLRQVAQSPEAAREKGRRGRERMVNGYSWERISALVLERLSALAVRSPARLSPPERLPADVEPLPLDGRRGVAFLNQPHWASPGWEEALVAYTLAFRPEDDVTLVLWLDPSQGVSEAGAVERVEAALRAAGLDPANIPDVLLVADALDRHGLARLHAAVDWVVPGPMPKGATRPRSSARVLPNLASDTWRAAARLVRMLDQRAA